MLSTKVGIQQIIINSVYIQKMLDGNSVQRPIQHKSVIHSSAQN
jgi:hypothetical protein